MIPTSSEERKKEISDGQKMSKTDVTRSRMVIRWTVASLMLLAGLMSTSCFKKSTKSSPLSSTSHTPILSRTRPCKQQNTDHRHEPTHRVGQVIFASFLAVVSLTGHESKSKIIGFLMPPISSSKVMLSLSVISPDTTFP